MSKHIRCIQTLNNDAIHSICDTIDIFFRAPVYSGTICAISRFKFLEKKDQDQNQMLFI